MNVANLEKLRDWLLAGAPEVYFSMSCGFGTVKGMSGFEKLQASKDLAATEVKNKSGLGECGTICCIGGAAYQFSFEEQYGKKPDAEDDLSWDDIQNRALNWLGLDWTYNEDEDESEIGDMHPLFEPTFAPVGCTPQEAAAAVQNVIDFDDPRWKEICAARFAKVAA